jgi:hypothetical protein
LLFYDRRKHYRAKPEMQHFLLLRAFVTLATRGQMTRQNHHSRAGASPALHKFDAAKQQNTITY